MDSPIETAHYEAGLFIDDSLRTSSQESSPGGRSSSPFGELYESFANILIPYGQGNMDRLEANIGLQQRLPFLLANMPERKRGERESNIDILLGPPGFLAGLCTLEVVVYLFSNKFVSVSNSSLILQWIVNTLSPRSLVTILRTRLPTLRQFQSDLLLYAVKTSRISLVGELLELDTGREDIVNSNEYLAEAVRHKDYEMIELLIASGSTVYHPLGKPFLAKCLVQHGVSVAIAQILAIEGYKFDETYVLESPFTTAVARGDIQLARFLINIGAGNLGSERTNY